MTEPQPPQSEPDPAVDLAGAGPAAGGLNGSGGHVPPPPTDRPPTPDAAAMSTPGAGADPRDAMDAAGAAFVRRDVDADLLRAIDARTDGLAVELRMQRQQLIAVTVGILLVGIMVYLAARRGHLRGPDAGGGPAG